MQKITSFLWFDGNAEEAANYYVSIFPNSKIREALTFSDAGPGPRGSVMTVAFELLGQEFVAINGGPQFHFTPAISFVIKCESQKEVDHYWNAFSKGGKEIQCGWITDKYGVTWQVVPTVLLEMIRDKNEARKARVMTEMMKMVKLGIAPLQAAYDKK